MSHLRRQRDACIPGLVPQAYIEGSQYKAPTQPVLKTSRIDDTTGHCDFHWEAKGSTGDTYDIRATGKLELVVVGDSGGTVGRGLKVICSCPDGQRQAVAPVTLQKMIVCKHGAAALLSVLDPEAMARHDTRPL